MFIVLCFLVPAHVLCVGLFSCFVFFLSAGSFVCFLFRLQACRTSCLFCLIFLVHVFCLLTVFVCSLLIVDTACLTSFLFSRLFIRLSDCVVSCCLFFAFISQSDVLGGIHPGSEGVHATSAVRAGCHGQGGLVSSEGPAAGSAFDRGRGRLFAGGPGCSQ